MSRASTKWCRRLGFALSLVFTLAVFSGSGANAASLSGSFCKDTAQLQSWIAQDFSPGIDQYNVPTDPAYVRSLAQYLQKLSQEAPVAARADLSVWAAFTESVANGASQANLVSRLSATRQAAQRTKVWLATKSGCRQLYVAAPVPVASHHKGHSYLPWIIAGVCVLVLLGAIGGRAQGRGNEGQRGPGGGEGRSVPSRGQYSTSSTLSTAPPQKPVEQMCPNCAGDGYRSYACRGSGGSSWSPCAQCQGSGRSPCSRCHGSGRITV